MDEPSAIAPNASIPDSLISHSWWNSVSWRIGNSTGSSWSRKTFANTSKAAALHFPLKEKVQKLEKNWILVILIYTYGCEKFDIHFEIISLENHQAEWKVGMILRITRVRFYKFFENAYFKTKNNVRLYCLAVSLT